MNRSEVSRKKVLKWMMKNVHMMVRNERENQYQPLVLRHNTASVLLSINEDKWVQLYCDSVIP